MTLHVNPVSGELNFYGNFSQSSMGVVIDNPEVLIMQKSKSASSGGRLNPRKIWRSRSKSQSRGSGSGITCLWTPQGSGVWKALGGRQVVLTDTTLINLTDVEAAALRQVALAKLQGMDLGCTISIPKTSDNSTVEKPKRRALILKKRALTTGFFEHGGKNKEDSDETRTSGMVFGVPLAMCIKNDRSCHRSASAPLRDVANLMGSRLKIGSASAEDISRERLIASRNFSGSQSSCNIPLDAQDERFFGKNDDGSYESINWVCKSHSMSGLSSLDCLQDWSASETEGEITPRIPDIINDCFKHLESYGLHRLGIFRVSSSKKRVRQLREDFDSGKEVQLNKDHCPHDVATLLKEYFRDLPEPLLTRDLYPAFVATQKIRNRHHQIDALMHLVQLLPPANRDTLWALLKFLAKVAVNAVDHRAETGEWVAGNKMDSNNLATLFGPNILHMAKAGITQGNEFQVESTKRADERVEVIKVVRTMIESYKELFEISATLLDEVYLLLLRQNPEAVSRLLTAKLPNEMDVDADTGSSACSETASVSQLPIDITMEVSAPLVISVHAESGSGPTTTHTWERTLSHTDSLPDENLTKRPVRDSNESLNSEQLPDRGNSQGPETSTKTESVASRLFRRRDKSVARGEEVRQAAPEEAAAQKSDDGRWFRRRVEKSGSASNVATKKTNASKSSESTNKKIKKEKEKVAKRDSESDGSGSSEQKSGSLKGSGRSKSRPLMFRENASGELELSKTTSRHQQVSVVDIRKEHLHVPDVSERRLSTPDVDATVISASLTLKVPLSRSQTGPALAFGQGRDKDIPFIEDLQPETPEIQKIATSTRQRYLDKRHRSTSFFPKNGNEPESKSVPGATSSVAAVAPVIRARQRSGSSEMSPLTTSASASAIHCLRVARGSRELAPIASGTVTNTVKSARGVHSRDSTSITTSQRTPATSTSAVKQNTSPSNTSSPKPRSRSSSRQESSNAPTRRSSANSQWPQETWKRWEIISSEHTEQETVV